MYSLMGRLRKLAKVGFTINCYFCTDGYLGDVLPVPPAGTSWSNFFFGIQITTLPFEHMRIL
jgi:hypothetical protein